MMAVEVYFRLHGHPGLWRFLRAYGGWYQVANLHDGNELTVRPGRCRIVAWKPAA